MASAVSWRRDRRTTSWPVLAAASAMPEPMIPDPTMPTRLTVMGRTLPTGSNAAPTGGAARLRDVRDHAVLAALYDRLMAPTERAGLADRRRRLLARARG